MCKMPPFVGKKRKYEKYTCILKCKQCKNKPKTSKNIYQGGGNKGGRKTFLNMAFIVFTLECCVLYN